jgi:hypothetical protein
MKGRKIIKIEKTREFVGPIAEEIQTLVYFNDGDKETIDWQLQLWDGKWKIVIR